MKERRKRSRRNGGKREEKRHEQAKKVGSDEDEGISSWRQERSTNKRGGVR